MALPLLDSSACKVRRADEEMRFARTDAYGGGESERGVPPLWWIKADRSSRTLARILLSALLT
jgi:hypothetical protein